MSERQVDAFIDTLLEALKNNKFDAVFAKNRREALQCVLDRISPSSVVGAGDSLTLKEIGIFEELKRQNFILYWPFDEDVAKEQRRDIARKALLSDVFLSGSNAITMDGKIVNVDASGNRVAGLIFGPKKAIVVVGINKVVENLDKALERIRNIAAPLNAKRIRGERRWELLPCVETGRCVDCNAENRICNVTAIIDKKPRAIAISVIIVGEKLGL